MQDLKNGQVSSHTNNGITTIEFYHPQSNSLPGTLLEEIAKEIHFAGTHKETKVIVLKSDGEKALWIIGFIIMGFVTAIVLVNNTWPFTVRICRVAVAGFAAVNEAVKLFTKGLG